MTGKWIFAAIAALLGALLSLEPRILTIIIILLLCIRLLIEKDRVLLITCGVVVSVVFLVGEYTKLSNKSAMLPTDEIDLHITFKQVPEIDGNRLQGIVTTPQKEKLMLSYTIQSEMEKNGLLTMRSGVSCKLKGELAAPLQNSNEHAFNYQNFLMRQQINLLFIPDQLSIHTCSKSSFSIVTTLQNIRAAGIERVKQKFPSQLIPYVEALIFGEREAFLEHTYDAYKRLGVVHLLAISGLHVGMVAGALYFLLLRIGLSRESTFWLLLFILPSYGVMSGGNPPVVRAILMTLLLLLSKRWRIRLTTLDAFSLSFLLFLLYNPYLIYHAGFQLSYAVSFSIIMSSSRLIQRNHSHFQQMLKLSFTSFLASLPILAYHFCEISLISILANIVFVPFYTLLVLPAIFVLYFLSFFAQSLFTPLAHVLSKMIEQSENIAKFTSSFRFSTLLTGKPSLVILLLLVVCSYAYFFFREKKRGIIFSILPLLLTLLLQLVHTNYALKGEIIFINVGQGDSILIKLPYNRGTYLIDTGGQIDFPMEEWQERRKAFRVGFHILLPLLKSKGIHQIDKLILTHPHIDHIGAAEQLLENVKIKELYITANSVKEKIMEELIEQAEREKISIQRVKAGHGWSNRSGSFSFIFPLDETYEGNNDSLVLYAKVGGLTWLFTGDAEKEAEEEMVRAYSNLKVDVLKVGHHGSRTSTTEQFIEVVQPSYAIISAGKNNRYGHPHAEVVHILEDRGVRILRTDEHGAIHYIFQKQEGTFRTILPYDVVSE